MKKIYLLACILFFISCKKKDVEEQSPGPTFYNYPGQPGYGGNFTVVSTDNNLIICGNTFPYGIYILKISKSGTQIWRKDLEPSSDDAFSIAQASNGNIFICGQTLRNSIFNHEDILLINMNSSGDTVWSKTYGGYLGEHGFNITSTSDGNLLIAATTFSFGDSVYGDIYLLKLNLNGDTLWTRSYPGPYSEHPRHLIETQNGEFLVTCDGGHGGTFYNLLKVDANGSQLWNKSSGTADGRSGASTIELSNGELLTCGSNKATFSTYRRVQVTKTDNLGNILWQKEYSDTPPYLTNGGNSIRQNADGSFTIVGSSHDNLTAVTKILLLKIDENGNQLLLKKFGDKQSQSGLSLIKDANDDNIIIGGCASEVFGGGTFMTRTDNNGNFK